jgi:hypothetical protein
MVSLRTDRLLLREFVEQDWRAAHDYATDPEVVRYMDWGPNTEEETRAFIRRAISFQRENPRRSFRTRKVTSYSGRHSSRMSGTSSRSSRADTDGYRHFHGESFRCGGEGLSPSALVFNPQSSRGLART